MISGIHVSIQPQVQYSSEFYTIYYRNCVNTLLVSDSSGSVHRELDWFHIKGGTNEEVASSAVANDNFRRSLGQKK